VPFSSPLVSSLLGLALVVAVVAAGSAVRAAHGGRALQAAQLAYVACSALGVAFASAFGVAHAAALGLLHAGPISNLDVTLACVLLSWLTFGALLFTLRPPCSPERVLSSVALQLLAFAYVNVLRERVEFGDVFDFVHAAQNLARGEHLHARYLYPPLYATLLEPLLPYGERWITLLLIVLNHGALLLFFVLLRNTLVRYGFSFASAVVVTFVALCANAPLLRTLFYVQTNLHVVNLALIALLCYPHRVVVSALALALAASIKTSPLLLALPFLLARDVRWLVWFAAGLLGLASITAYGHGFEPFQDYVSNAANIYRANGINFRDNSVDSILRASYSLLGMDPAAARAPVQLARGALLVIGLWLCRRAVAAGLFSDAAPARVLLVRDTYPVLMLVMTTVSPLFWEHHPVLMLLPIVLIVRRIDGPGEALLWLSAHFMIYLVPTFDIYPFSFHRMLGALLVYALIWHYTRAPRRNGSWFEHFERRLAALVATSSPACAGGDRDPIARRPG